MHRSNTPRFPLETTFLKLHRAGPVGVVVLVVVLLLGDAPARAGVCTVPGTHASIQNAVDDPACTTTQLGGETFVESVEVDRAADLLGHPGGDSTIAGSVVVTGAGSTVLVEDVSVSGGCEVGLLAAGGAEVVGSDLHVVLDPSAGCPAAIFADGFETGDTTAW